MQQQPTTMIEYQAVLESIGDGIIVTDKSARIIYMNEAASKMLLWKVEDALGKDMVDVVPAADPQGNIIPKEKRSLYSAINTGVSFSNHIANYYMRRDGTKFPGAITTSPVMFNGETIGAVVSFRDITRNAEIDRMKTEFLSLASHQLRTPLSAMKWFLEMLLDGDAGLLNKEQKEFVTNVDESNNRMIDLVNDLLNITRIESDRIIIDPKPTNLSKLIEDVLVELKPKFQANKQKIIVSCNPNLAEINIDANLIRAVYLNLLSNAIKYTPAGGEITVIVSNKGNEVVSQISDSGLGIPKDEQNKVFSRFFRAKNIIKKVVDGTGLGLYLAKAIVDSSGGKMSFKSEEDKGTTFWFSIPKEGMKAREGQVTLGS
ncbi:MAG: multi-sensor signal transduction histidine kinase [uncultured bacterium]|nr:MAG: multi-sensor signal transduction histidine kinase [uncultured bacterium]